MTPLAFLPDADPSTPGVMVECVNLIPTNRGYQDAPLPITMEKTALPGTERIISAVTLSPLSGYDRTYVASTRYVYKLDPTGSPTWTTVLTSAFENDVVKMSFRQFGDVSLVTNPVVPMMAATTGSFATVTDAPAAVALCVAENFVMALGTAAEPDGWACSALADHTDWTPDIATQSATGRFLATPGPVTAGFELGDYVVAFKERSMYLMRYVGAPLIWTNEVVSNEIGCSAPLSIVDVGDRILFLGPDDIYSFDGTRPVSIGGGVRRWFLDQCYAGALFFNVQAVFDGRKVYWFYSQSVSTTPDRALVLDIESGRWGHVDYNCAAPFVGRNRLRINGDFNYVAPEVYGFTPERLLTVSADRSADAEARLGWMGADEIASTMTKLRPRWLKFPRASSAQFFKSAYLDVDEIGDLVNFNNNEGSWDCQQQAKWHSARLKMKGPFEIGAIGNDIPRPAKR